MMREMCAERVLWFAQEELVHEHGTFLLFQSNIPMICYRRVRCETEVFTAAHVLCRKDEVVEGGDYCFIIITSLKPNSTKNTNIHTHKHSHSRAPTKRERLDFFSVGYCDNTAMREKQLRLKYSVNTGMKWKCLTGNERREMLSAWRQ